MDKFTLANGSEIAHLNRYETEFLFNEIFEEKVYLRNGVKLSSNSVIFDVGSNIGIFALFIESEFPGSKIFLFEPVPELCEILEENVKGFINAPVIYKCGVAEGDGEAQLTYYPGYSIMSGIKATDGTDRELLKTSIAQQLSLKPGISEVNVEKMADFLVAGKLDKPITRTCKLISLSEVIRLHDIQHIDLLKIDAERSEIDILKGIAENDWPKIRQIVIEVHDAASGALAEVQAKLEVKGFKVIVDQGARFADTGVFNVFALRK